ncbi:hypothetical protein B7L68_01300 [Thermoproteus sp. CP80]|nr:hypothetical protein B7L68_01300 [Thermoproteus sp. CP80]
MMFLHIISSMLWMLMLRYVDIIVRLMLSNVKQQKRYVRVPVFDYRVVLRRMEDRLKELKHVNYSL